MKKLLEYHHCQHPKEALARWEHLKNGLMMFYNRNELYSYSKSHI